ncbi:MAG TPA: hypothetical protein VJ866_07520 [Pyrinomonadaceae bacterium]|nr:hypothetical protein [Pyrinomonadaceae bacterium]
MPVEESNDPPIVVTGGSVHLDFDEKTLPGTGGKHSNGKKLKHITVEIDGAVVLDKKVPSGDMKVTVTYGP